MKKVVARVFVKAKIENLGDLFRVEWGDLSADQVRTVVVDDALVDTRATLLSLPDRFFEQLGLKLSRTRKVQTADGPIDSRIYGAVRLTIQQREFTTDVNVVPDSCPVVIGQTALLGLDFVVDPIGQKLIGNPEHGGEQMVEIY